MGGTEVGCRGEEKFCEGVEYAGVVAEDFDVEHFLRSMVREIPEG